MWRISKGIQSVLESLSTILSYCTRALSVARDDVYGLFGTSHSKVGWSPHFPSESLSISTPYHHNKSKFML